jgi:hypothetical protein
MVITLNVNQTWNPIEVIAGQGVLYTSCDDLG